MRSKSTFFKIAALIIAVLCVAELAVRFSGLVDFPVYAVDDQIGYIVQPNQSGRFLNKNAWAFNSRSMPTAREWPPQNGGPPNVMLIGNSVVMGGNPMDLKDTLAPQIAADLGSHYSVWPLGIGGWTTVNEITYLQRNPDVVSGTSFFIWEYMRGGLSGPSAWRGAYVFPTQRPLLASWFALRRYVLPHFLPLSTNELPPTGDLVPDRLADFRAALGTLSRASARAHPGVIFLYPEKKDLIRARAPSEWLPERQELQALCREFNLTLVDITQDSRWNDSLYRDGTHPTPHGNVVLARILADAALATLASNSP
jgi:hypothetical protein